MRLVSFRTAGSRDEPWHPGAVTEEGIVALGPVGDSGGPSGTAAILALDPQARRSLIERAREHAVASPDDLELGPPVPRPGKILCIGLNYVDHASEAQLEPPPVPTVFAKFANSLIGPGAAIEIPSATTQVDYEGELAVVIGRRTRRIREADARGHVAGVMPFNDVSARDLQFETSQWTAGKALDTFAPCGPELVLLDEVPGFDELRVETRVNEKLVQSGATADMIFSVERIVSFLSSFLTLEPGDVIATGTPAGVGFTREPPLWLRPGDKVSVSIAGIGHLSNPVVAEPHSC